MSRAAEFLLQNWGNLASVAGLILSGLAAIFAHRALTEVYALVRRQVLKTDVKLDDVLSELKKL